MRPLVLILSLAAHFCCIQGIIQWPQIYFLEGEKIDLIQRNIVPFKAWFDFNDYRYRVEAYNGTLATHIDMSNETMYMIHNKADVEGNAKRVCSIMFEDISLVEPLPDVDRFHLTGQVMREGKSTQIWTNTEEFGNIKIEDTVYVYNNTPLRFAHKYFNTETGALIDDYVVNYFNYTDKVKEDDFMFDGSGCTPLSDNNIDFKKSLEYHNFHFAFHGFKKYHQRQYREEEHALRKTIFKQNWRIVKEHNSKNLTYKMALNKFSDRTPEEMTRLHSIRPHMPEPGTHEFPYTEAELEDIVKELPEEFDWRTEGAVSRVKSQGNCGSCWAFATTASIEGALSVKYKTNFDLSEQSIVDCAWAYKVYGCSGGYSELALKYVMEHGIPTEEDYGEYMGVDGECHINNMTRKFKVAGYAAVTPMSENALKAAVYMKGPVATYVYTSYKMHSYSSGIFYEAPDPDRRPDIVNHVVVVVGYGVRDGMAYWIVKNSYGQDWGEDGYILVATKDNTANILFAPYYPIL